MNNTRRHKKTFSALFLAAYLTFVITNVIHFHSYSFFNEPSVKEPVKSQSPGSHYFIDGSSICVIHQFSNTVLDLKYSSDNLLTASKLDEELNLVLSDKLPPRVLYSKHSPRAPPIFS